MTGVLSRFWYGWTREAFRGMRQYLGLALPGMMMMVLKWWAFGTNFIPCTTLLFYMYVANNHVYVCFYMCRGFSGTCRLT
jgi:hypothetical protein